MMYRNKKFRQGLTLIELILACVIGVMITLIMGILLYTEQRNWSKTYARVNKGIEIDALQTMITFGINGRKSNKMNYRVYKVSSSNKFERVKPSSLSDIGIPTNPIDGKAVEFRYWNELIPDATLMDPCKTATAYMLIYRNGDKLMADCGPYPPGGIDGSGYRITGNNVATKVLAEHVTNLTFSHTPRTMAGDGDGSIRMEITFFDQTSNRSITLKTATLMRNVW
jgi:hypothetical protein